MSITVVGIDAAFANMGFARAVVTPIGLGHVGITSVDLRLVSTEITEDRKVVRKSSTELRRAQELVRAIAENCQGKQVAFVEVPSGSQSASAARALGIAVGVIASCPIPVIEVSPMEVKRIVNAGLERKGKMNPSKLDVIAWAARRWPEAPWIRHQRTSKGKLVKGVLKGAYKAGDLTNANEHLADALATIAAGVETNEFKRLLALLPSAPLPSPSRARVRLL